MSSPTLEDVAREAGVSTATVSRCLNSPERVLENTRQKVSEAVNKLGYTPHFAAQALASKRSNTFGALIPTMENSIFARAIQALQVRLATDGITLLVASSNYDPEREFDQIKTLAARGVDALMLVGIERPAKAYEYLRQRNIPYVVAWTLDSSFSHPFVGFDNCAASERMANAILQQGHRNVAMIAGVTRSNDRATNRVQGVRKALKDHGLPGDDLPVVEAPYTLESGGEAFEQLMQGDPAPTAIICGNDVLAVGAIQRAKELGLDVPGDVSITGFDNIDIASVVDPRLTTIHVPHRRMGTAVAELLINLRKPGQNCHSVELETELVVGGSLGPAPDKGGKDHIGTKSTCSR